MAVSMTGYGRGEADLEGISFLVEVRSVNHRYRDIFFRIPRELLILEEKMRQLISQKITRGRLEVFVTIRESGDRGKKVEVDLHLAQGYYKALEELKNSFNLSDKITLKQISSFPDVLNIQKEEALSYWPVMEKALLEALKNLISMRQQEGENLKKDLNGRLEQIEMLLKEIQGKAPLVVDFYRQKLLDRLAQMLPKQEIDENRLLMECTLFAERSSINEEVVRLASHLGAFRKAINGGGTVGRKMDFLVQELYREINTIGSKANDYQIARLVVEVKSELEKIREQVQNIE
ncbi:MAG: YicC family protein [Firmicutes bacterium HGW-Firmicutes-13]|nr:MAG: YicC family protein [Firmicutes bacterium HGW-Firmicutes-13]